MLRSIRHGGQHLEAGHAYEVEDAPARSYINERTAVLAPRAEAPAIEAREPAFDARDPRVRRRA